MTRPYSFSFVSADWEAAGHALGWAERLELAGALLFALAFAALVLRALLVRGRYRAAGVLSAPEEARVHAALVAAERKTRGEILLVVVERCDRHPGASAFAAASIALLGTLALAPWLTLDEPVLVLALELALAALGFALARLLPGFQRAFLGEARAREMAEEQAFQEFHRYGLHATEGRTGVLLFVGLLEHRVVVLADEGIAAHVAKEQWSAVSAAVLAGIRGGSLAEGLVAGIERAGALLAAHAPPASDERNEVPDRLVVRRE